MFMSLDLAALDAAMATGGPQALGFNWALRLLLGIDLLKFGPPVLLLLHLWLTGPAGRQDRRAEFVLRGGLGILAALAVTRAMQGPLPPRPRPFQALPDMVFPPLGGLPDHGDFSSFPSDHAVLAFALVVATWAGSRRYGMASAIWAVGAVCFPRLYFGLHWLTDLLAGAAIGLLVTGAAMAWAPLPGVVLGWARRVETRAPALGLLLMFLFCVEVIGLFQNTRKAIGAAQDVAQALDLRSRPGLESGAAAAETGPPGHGTIR